MKSILVGKLNESKLYYVIDSIDEKSDGVLIGPIGDATFVDFWKIVDTNRVHKIRHTTFHDYLWTGHKAANNGLWYSTFVIKSVPIAEELLDGAVINYDVLRRKSKMLDYENRAIDYKASMSSQSISNKIFNRFVDPDGQQRRTRGKRNS